MTSPFTAWLIHTAVSLTFHSLSLSHQLTSWLPALKLNLISYSFLSVIFSFLLVCVWERQLTTHPSLLFHNWPLLPPFSYFPLGYITVLLSPSFYSQYPVVTLLTFQPIRPTPPSFQISSCDYSRQVLRPSSCHSLLHMPSLPLFYIPILLSLFASFQNIFLFFINLNLSFFLRSFAFSLFMLYLFIQDFQFFTVVLVFTITHTPTVFHPSTHVNQDNNPSIPVIHLLNDLSTFLQLQQVAIASHSKWWPIPTVCGAAPPSTEHPVFPGDSCSRPGDGSIHVTWPAWEK